MNARSLPRVACMALGLAAAGCDGATTPTAPAPTPLPSPGATTTLTYSGVFGSGMFTGTVTLSAVVPVSTTVGLTDLVVSTATGTAKFTGATQSTISLSGTFDTATNRFLLTGGSFKVDATVSNGAVTGTIVTAVGSGGLVALPTSDTNPATRFCGLYSGSESGKFHVLVRGSTVSGLAAQNGDPDSITLTGTATGNLVNLGWAWTEDGGGHGTAIGTIAAPNISGTWSNTVGKSGSWSGSTTGC